MVFAGDQRNVSTRNPAAAALKAQNERSCGRKTRQNVLQKRFSVEKMGPPQSAIRLAGADSSRFRPICKFAHRLAVSSLSSRGLREGEGEGFEASKQREKIESGQDGILGVCGEKNRGEGALIAESEIFMIRL